MDHTCLDFQFILINCICFNRSYIYMVFKKRKIFFFCLSHPVSFPTGNHCQQILIIPFEKNPSLFFGKQQTIHSILQIFFSFFYFIDIQFLWTSFLLELEQFKLLWNLCRRYCQHCYFVVNSSRLFRKLKNSLSLFFLKWMLNDYGVFCGLYQSGFYRGNRTNLRVGGEEERDRLIHRLFDFKELAHAVVGAVKSEICRVSQEVGNSGKS